MPEYQPMTVAALAEHQTGRDESYRWRLVAEFLEEYRHEPRAIRRGLLEEEPGATGDPRWDVFLAALAEHLAAREGSAGPDWVYGRRLENFWFPFDTAAARADALVHSPASFRGRGIFISPHELKVA
jgi:hypothetical protein